MLLSVGYKSIEPLLIFIYILTRNKNFSVFLVSCVIVGVTGTLYCVLGGSDYIIGTL